MNYDTCSFLNILFATQDLDVINIGNILHKKN
jgi:hypothetical protein